MAWVDVTLSAEFHSHFEWLDVALAVLSGFFDEELAVADDEAHEALVAQHVGSLCVGVQYTALGPLAQTAVLTLCKRKRKRGLIVSNDQTKMIYIDTL